MILETHRIELGTWKSSPLAMMAYGVDEATRRDLRCGYLKKKTLNQTSNRMTVFMKDSPDGIELTATSPSSMVPLRKDAEQSSSVDIGSYALRRSQSSEREEDDEQIPLEP